MLTAGGLWLSYFSENETTEREVELLVDSVHLFHGDGLRSLNDESFYNLHARFRHAFGHRMVCYYHLLALNDVGRLVHIPDERRTPIDVSAAFDNVRLLCFLLFHAMSALQKDICRRKAIHGDRVSDAIFPEEELSNPELRWMFLDYVRWCRRYTHENMMKPDLIVSILRHIEGWRSADLYYMSVMREQLLVLKRVMELDVDVVLHVTRPIDMSRNQYPTMDLLAYYEARMRGISGVEYNGIVMYGGHNVFPQLERANSF